MTRKWKYIFDAEDIFKFKFCPGCGRRWVVIYDGDHDGNLECWDCDFEVNFKITWEDSE